MANESPLLHWGWGTSATDMRNSSITGTTLSGPNGSGQFLAVQMSTVAGRTVLYASTASGKKIVGIEQSKPAVGDASDVGFLGISKAVAGAAINPGAEVMASSTAPGTLIPFSSAVDTYACGRNVGDAAAVGDVFSCMLYGTGGNLA